MELIYIILPVYNGEKYILQQLMSIYFQDYENWHLIVINDGSTDSTKSIIDKYISDYELQKKVTIINQSNKGLNKSIENGLIEAKRVIKLGGNDDVYITYCDADDLMMTNRLSYQVNYMKTHKECDLSYHDLILMDENNSIIDLSYLKIINKSIFVNIKCDRFYEYCLLNHMPSTTIMFKANKIDSLIPFPNTFPFQDWWTALVFSGNNYNIKNIGIPLGFYRRYKNQMSDTSRTNKELAKKFNEYISSLKYLKLRLKDKNRINEINEYIKYFTNRTIWLGNNNSIGLQLLYIVFKHPKLLIYKLMSYIKK